MSFFRTDLRGRCVLITGGTRGLGRAIGIAFAQRGATVWLTCKWGSVPEDEVREAFARADAVQPRIVEADAARDDDTRALLAEMAAEHDGVDVLVSNVAFGQVGEVTQTWSKRSMLRSLEYTSWPLMGYLQLIHDAFSAWPRYALVTSSDGPDRLYPGYDYVAVSKTVVETFVRYLGHHLWPDCRVNVLRSNPVDTASLAATFGDDFAGFLREEAGENYLIREEEVAAAALALCSGRLDAMTGQVLTVDRGLGFGDNVRGRYPGRAS